jgi:hypothetical protein
MPEGSGGPWTSSGAHVAAPPRDATRTDSIEPIDRRGSIPDFPTERAERGIELVSRFAGPVVFVATLVGIAWLLLK